MKKSIKLKIFISLIIVALISGTLILSSIPDQIILFEGEKFDLGPLFTVDSQTDSTMIVRNGISDYDSNGYFADVKLAGVVSVKTVKVDFIERPKVIPGGNSIGVKLYVDGLMVVGLSEFPSSDGSNASPGKDAGIKIGDIITEINGNKIFSARELTQFVSQREQTPITLKALRNGKAYSCTLTPKPDSNNDLKLGIWVRNSVAGIGTLTFYDPVKNVYGALGHGITDSDTGKVVPLGRGEIVQAEISSVIKGKRGSPGELRGNFASKSILGNVIKNTNCGIYGNVESSETLQGNPIEIASRSEVTEGEASIISCINGSDIKEYNIEIQRVSHNKISESKSMVIKVTDPELIENTGGILQGMSGSPIIQNGKLVGAVTHVFVNDPTRGYGIFIENMLDEAKN